MTPSAAKLTRTSATFAAWMAAADAAVWHMAGVSAADLADYLWADDFEDGVSAGAAARRAVRSDRCGD